VLEGEYRNALAFYERAAELNNEDIETKKQLVNLHLTLEDDLSAIHLLHEIISMNPKDAEAYQLLISLYQQAQVFDAIIKLKENYVSYQEL
jgi:tetratricopeptide (TPR) repeat protein